MNKAAANAIPKSKLAILFNSAHHVDYGGDDPDWDNYWHSSLVIEEGKILRNDPNFSKGGNFVGIDNENNLLWSGDKSIFPDYKTASGRKTVFDKFINSGVRNNLQVYGKSVNNGVGEQSTVAKSAFAGFCQIDKNNYVHIVIDNRYRKYTVKQLGEFFIAQGCYNAWRVDGGGSNNVKIKKENRTTTNTIIEGDNNGNRHLWNALYWSEL